MEKKRRIFLFGAGAALEWGGPTTSELTNLVLEGGFLTCDGTTTITRYIYMKLLDEGYKEKDVNFETIISIIEEFVVFYSNHNRDQAPSFQQCFFDAKFRTHLLNFSVAGERHGYTLKIPKGVKYQFSKISNNGETPEQFFFEHLIGDLLNDICARIVDYSYYSESHSTIDLKSESSKSFIEWMGLHQQQTPLRLYSLNYDRVFKVLLQQVGFNIFEGFDDNELTETKYPVRASVKKILANDDGNVHYNLHGAVNWDVIDLDHHQFPNAEVVYKSFPHLPGNNTPASVQVERGKTLMITNIITGYQKAQKSMVSPFKQMQSAFDKDCCISDEIYIIGYSFGDEHINMSIRTAIRHNPTLKVVLVDPYFMKEDHEVKLTFKLFSAASKPLSTPRRIDENVHIHHENFVAYSMSFEQFRKRQVNPFNKAAGGVLDW